MNEIDKDRHAMATYSSSIPHLFFQDQFDVTNLLPIIEAAQ